MWAHGIVSQFFLFHNFPTYINGFHYAREGIVFVMENQYIDCHKSLFLHIAEKFQTNCDNVERCIRTFIDKTWTILCENGLFSEKPTSREFVLKCAEQIRAEYGQNDFGYGQTLTCDQCGYKQIGPGYREVASGYGPAKRISSGYEAGTSVYEAIFAYEFGQVSEIPSVYDILDNM